LEVKAKKVKQACTECEKKDRLIAIQTIMAGIPYDNEEPRNSALKSFFNANLTLEEIDALTKPLKNQREYRNEFNKRTGGVF